MREIEISARTVEEAIEIALKELDADRVDVEVDVVNRGKSGILGIGSEPAVVRVSAIESAPDSVTVASSVIQTLIDHLDADVVLTLKQVHNDDLDGPIFEIEGDDAGLLIGRKGETLKTLQFLVRYVVSHKLDERVNLMIDVEGYQQRRHQSLENMAHRVARRVSDTGRSITLEPMPANERRIVHIALSDHPGVTTESTGFGDSRQVTVEPS
ncbi:MAG: protein jag [Dehalococcoidia bacterium]|nr:protein jag [Dehalococcoidia bacterium]